MAEWINVLLQGLLLGGLYALFATGLALVFGVMKVLNVAHGDFIVLAGYLGVTAVELLGLSPFASLILVAPAMAALGYGLQRWVLNKVVGDDVLPPLLVTFGLSIVIQNLLQEIFSADARGLDVGSLATASLSLGGDVAVGVYPLILLATAVVILGGLQLLFTHTAIGRAFRATADDPAIARLMGIDSRHVFALATALAMAVVGIAGVYLAIRTNITPTIGPSRLLFAFEAVIIGGLGSLWGALLGGMALGVSQSIGFKLDPGWGLLFGHCAFLTVLVARPQGLFPRTRNR